MVIMIEGYDEDEIVIDPEMFSNRDSGTEASVFVLDEAAVTPDLLVGLGESEAVSLNALIASSFGADNPTHVELADAPLDPASVDAFAPLADFDPLTEASVTVILDDDMGYSAPFDIIV